MKKRTTLSSILFLVISLFTTAVYAQSTTQALGIIQTIVSFFGSVLKIFFGDPTTQAGQITMLKFLFFLAVAVGIYELLARLAGLRPLVAAIIGVLASAATIILIPGGALLAVFSAAGSLVTLLVVAALLVPPTILTWFLMKRKKWAINGILIFFWVLLLLLFTVSVGVLNGAGWIIFLMFVYILGVIVFIITYTLSTNTASVVGSSFSKKIRDWSTQQLTTQSNAVEHDLENQTRKLRAQYAGWADAAAFKDNFGDIALLELGKIAALLKVEKTKISDTAITGQIDIILKAIEGNGGHFGSVIIPGAPRGGLNKWIAYLNTKWGEDEASMDPAQQLSSANGKTAEVSSRNGLANTLAEVEGYLKTINRQIASTK